MNKVNEIVMNGKDILNLKIQNYKLNELNKSLNVLFFIFQPIIYIYRIENNYYQYGGNINYLQILLNIDNYNDEIKEILLQKNIICSIIMVEDIETQKCLIDMQKLFIRGENIKMSSDLIETIKEEDIRYSNDDLYNISSWGADLSFRELVLMYDDGELLKPELQRKYVWTKNEASRFIDSILLGLPVPSIFLAKEKDEKNLLLMVIKE